MFTFLDASGAMAIRLSKDDLKAFFEKYDTGHFMAHNTVMKEYALVPDSLMEDTDELSRYLEMSYAYVKSLKPKPQKKPKT